MNQSERRNFLIQSLLEESREYRGMQIPSDSTGQRQLLRGLMNVRMVKKSSAAKSHPSDTGDFLLMMNGRHLETGAIIILAALMQKLMIMYLNFYSD